MPYADNKGVRIYYELDGHGPPLVLAHGSSGSLNAWRRLGYVDAFNDAFTLVLFDTRGHGRSDRPHEMSAYAADAMVGDVVAVLDDAGISAAHYLGYSMGARTGFRVAVVSPDRFLSFVLGGCSPYSGEAERGFYEETLVEFSMLRTDPAAVVRRRETGLGRILTVEEKEELLGNDGEALVASAKARFEWPDLTNDELLQIAKPCLVYCGDADPSFAGARDGAKHMPQARFLALPGLDHTQALVRRDLVAPRVREFLLGQKSGSRTLT